MHACSTYYHQGSELCADLEPFFKKLSTEVKKKDHYISIYFVFQSFQISVMQYETFKISKELENRHSIVSTSDFVPKQTCGKESLLMEGYLFKRTSNAFKTWNRRWFYLYKNKLVYRWIYLCWNHAGHIYYFVFWYRKRSGEEGETIMEDDLRICTVKPVAEGDRRFCFEVLSPSK